MATRPASCAELEHHIGDLADAFGWRHHHSRYPGLTRDGYADGFPVDVLLRDGRLILVTIAGTDGALTEPEAAWVDELGAKPTVEMYVIPRGDFHSLSRALRLPDERSAATPRRPARTPRAEPRAPPRTPEEKDVRPAATERTPKAPVKPPGTGGNE